MELLVATLVHTIPGRDADALTRIRYIAETIRNALGLVNARFYRSRNNSSDPYYFMLTTWEDEERWQKAQERYNPRQLALTSAGELLKAPPEQWQMHYLWGYSRPSAEPILAAAHLVTIMPDQTERTQRSWIESARRQAVQPTLAFAFLARGSKEDSSIVTPHQSHSLSGTKGLGETQKQSGITFLNLLSWPSEGEREEYYADPNYQSMNRFLSSVGIVQVLAIDPI